MTARTFSVSCQCGNSIDIFATDAGSTIDCRCGQTVRVPRLSELRIASGLDAAESSIRDTIARMVREETLPWGDYCAVTGVRTSDVMLFDVQCEKSYVKGRGAKWWGMALLILGFAMCLPVAIFFWLIGRDLYKKEAERLGRDVVITIPLRVCREEQLRVRKWPQTRLKSALRSVPVFDQLLSEYPEAAIYPH